MKKNKTKNYYVIFALSATIIILITSQFSPLFKFDSWGDPGCFYTVGSGMMHGLVPYKDLFEQKGPLLYLIFGIASLIRPNWDIFFGGYFLEVIVLTASMIMLFKITYYITKKQKISILISLILPIIQCSGIVGVSGGVPESISIPLILGLIYFTLKFMNEGFRASRKSIFIQGILLGLVFWMKYTLIGAWIGLGLITFIILLKNRRFSDLLNYILTAFCGFLLVTVPWLIYFGMNHALKSLWQTYFYYNIGFYHDTTPLVIKLGKSLWYTIFPWTDGFSTCGFSGYLSVLVWILFIIGEFLGIFSNKILKNWIQRTTILIMLGFNGVLEYWGGFHWIQYKLILIPFICFGLIWIAVKCSELRISKLLYILISCFTIFTLLIINANLRSVDSKLKSALTDKNEVPVEIEFSKIMHSRVKNPTLLTYDNMCAQFYYAANIQPINRYFVKLASTKKEYPPMMENQKNVVKNKKVDYVICQAKSKEQFYKKHKDVLENYKIINVKSGYYLLEKCN